MDILIFLVGLVLLVGGAQVLINSAVKLARWFGISEFLIGLTIVTIGTNLPETMVSVTGALYRFADKPVSSLVVGEIIGSNLALLGVVIAISTLIHHIKIKHHELVQHGAFAAASVLMLWVLGRDGLLTRADGLLLMMLYLLYVVFITRGKHKQQWLRFAKKPNVLLTLILIFVSAFCLIIGAQWVLDYGTKLALSLGINQTLVGLFLIGPSTSLPELVVNVSAAIKKKTALSLGNILGTIVYSIAVALGAGVVLAEFQVVPQIIQVDMPFLVLMTFIVLLFFYTREKMQRTEGILLLSLYAVYAVMKFLLQ